MGSLTRLGGLQSCVDNRSCQSRQHHNRSCKHRQHQHGHESPDEENLATKPPTTSFHNASNLQKMECW